MPLSLVVIAGPAILLPIFLALGLPALVISRENEESDQNHVFLTPVFGAALLVILLAALRQAGLRGTTPVLIAVGFATGAFFFGLLRLKPTGLLKIARRLSAPLILFAVSYLVLMSPFVLQNQVGVSGYNVNSDSVVHTVLADYIGGNDKSVIKQPLENIIKAADRPGATNVGSSFAQVIGVKISEGYPLGFHYVLGMLSALTGILSFYLFNSVIAVFASLTVFVLYFLAGHLGIRRWLAVTASLFLTISYLTIGYSLQGFAPQVAMTPFLYTAMIGLYGYYRRPVAWRAGALAAISIAAAMIIYSFTSLLWLAPFSIGVIIVNHRLFKVSVFLRRTAVLLISVSVLVLFTVLPILERYLAPLKQDVVGKNELGNLVGKISPATASGVWLNPDFRFYPAKELYLVVSYAFAAAILFLAIFGLIKAVRTGRHFVWLSTLTGAGAVIFLDITSGPYYYSKALQLSAAEIFDRFGGHIRLMAKTTGIAFISMLFLVSSISDVAEIRSAAITPTTKLAALSKIDKIYAGRGPVLFLEKDDWGKYFLRETVSSSFADGAYRALSTDMRRSTGNRSIIDFDSISYQGLKQFQMVVGSPQNMVSLPNPSFAPISANTYYTVYKKNSGLFNNVLEHIPAETLKKPEPEGGVILQPGQSLENKFGYPISGSIVVAAYALPDIALRLPVSGASTSTYKLVSNVSDSRGPVNIKISALRAGNYEVFVKGKLATELRLKTGEKEIAAQPQKVDPSGYADIGPLYLNRGENSVTINSAKPIFGSGNYLEKVVFIAKNRRGGGRLRIIGNMGTAGLRFSLTPGVRQIEAKNLVSGASPVTLKNESAMPVKVDWMELLSEPYPLSVLNKYNRYYSSSLPYLLAGP